MVDDQPVLCDALGQRAFRLNHGIDAPGRSLGIDETHEDDEEEGNEERNEEEQRRQAVVVEQALLVGNNLGDARVGYFRAIADARVLKTDKKIEENQNNKIKGYGAIKL